MEIIKGLILVLRGILFICQALISIIFIVWSVWKGILAVYGIYIKYKDIKIFECKNKKSKDYIYFREVPNNENTVVGVTLLTKSLYKLFYMYNSNYPYKIIQATMLELEIAGFLNIDENNKKETIIRINDKHEGTLKMTQKIILHYIIDIINGENEITIEEFKKRISKNRHLYKLTFNENFIYYAIKEQEELGNCTIEHKKYYKYVKDFMIIFVFLFIMFMALGLAISSVTIKQIQNLSSLNYIIETIVIAISSIALLFDFWIIIKIIIKMKKYEKWKKIEYNGTFYVKMTEQGIKEQEKWNSLKKYLKDYTLIKEYNVDSLEINKEFLVYATLFGVADNTQESLGKYGPIMVYWK